jgi:peptidoglycan/xylan/chitin deacetylase (PgdA/CDA1 family)
MFHHFCDELHPKGQGAISAEQLDAMIDFLGRENILSAQDWLEGRLAGTLEENQTIFTFDDNLRCQYDVALPVLEARDITAAWFVYTSPLDGVAERIEVYRYFRTVQFDEIEVFYAAFDAAIKESDLWPEVSKALEGFTAATYLQQFSFYSDGDRRFRYIRDRVLGREKFYSAMDTMIELSGFDVDEARKSLWMDANQLKHLDSTGHVIGLHSHTHPTEITALSVEEQRSEYTRNSDLLHSLTGVKAVTMSHPCNSYSDATLDILKDLGIQTGFCSNYANPSHSPLEIPREDHADIIRRII